MWCWIWNLAYNSDFLFGLGGCAAWNLWLNGCVLFVCISWGCPNQVNVAEVYIFGSNSTFVLLNMTLANLVHMLTHPFFHQCLQILGITILLLWLAHCWMCICGTQVRQMCRDHLKAKGRMKLIWSWGLMWTWSMKNLRFLNFLEAFRHQALFKTLILLLQTSPKVCDVGPEI